MFFALYGRWEDLAACKILLRGVGIICPLGKQHSENFVFSTFGMNIPGGELPGGGEPSGAQRLLITHLDLAEE